MSEKNPYRKESYQEIIALALSQTRVDVSCKTLTALCNRGALALFERDDEGRNVIERFCEHAPLCQEMIETIDLLGGRNTWAKPVDGKFTVMDQQEAWLKGKETFKADTSHRGTTQKIDKVMAYMIGYIDQTWLGVEKDRGATTLARLISSSRKSLECVKACWDRGADIHARLEDGTLAVANINSIDLLRNWIQRGGNVHAPIKAGRDQPVWSYVSGHLQLSQEGIAKDHSHEIEETFKGLVDDDHLSDECAFLEAWHQRGNQTEMLKRLVNINNWNEARRPDGTPVWLAALEARPELLDNFINRKRARPDITQRDHMGRSAWFAILNMKRLDTDLLEKELPLRDYGHDTQGRGLLVQLIESVGGVSAFTKQDPPNCHVPLQYRFNNVLKMLEEASDQEKAALMDGLETVDFTSTNAVEPAKKKILAVRIFSSQHLVRNMKPADVMDLGRAIICSHLHDEKGYNISVNECTPVFENMRWVLATHGMDFPGEVKRWMDAFNALDAASISFDQTERHNNFKEVVLPIMKSVLSQSSMLEQVEHPSEVKTVPTSTRRGIRF